jgi:hypothetical protein
MNWLHFFTALLIVAKIAGAITFSWWCVFAPSILSITLAMLIIAVVLVIGFLED